MATKATLFVERDTSSAGLAETGRRQRGRTPGYNLESPISCSGEDAAAVLQIDFAGLLRARDDSLNQSLLAKEIDREVTSVDPN